MTGFDKSVRERLRDLPSLEGPFPNADLDSLPDTPRNAFRLWLEDAITKDIKDLHAMTLSTVDEQGRPDARIVILKNVDERGWHFSINANSVKGKQLVASHDVALTFYWPQLGRQVRLCGKAVELSSQECAEDFMARPKWSKVATLGSKQSQVLQTDGDLQDGLAEARNFLEANPGYVIPGWKVYVVQPDTAEFWQGASDRLHRRLQYFRTVDQEWRKRKLWP